MMYYWSKVFFLILFLFGIFHWLSFYLLVTSAFPLQWQLKDFTVNDWYKEIAYLRVLQESIQQGILPFKV